MATILRCEDEEEFFAQFIRVEGERGTVLIFPSDDSGEPNAQDMALAESIAGVIDVVPK